MDMFIRKSILDAVFNPAWLHAHYKFVCKSSEASHEQSINDPAFGSKANNATRPGQRATAMTMLEHEARLVDSTNVFSARHYAPRKHFWGTRKELAKFTIKTKYDDYPFPNPASNDSNCYEALVLNIHLGKDFKSNHENYLSKITATNVEIVMDEEKPKERISEIRIEGLRFLWNTIPEKSSKSYGTFYSLNVMNVAAKILPNGGYRLLKNDNGNYFDVIDFAWRMPKDCSDALYCLPYREAGAKNVGEYVKRRGMKLNVMRPDHRRVFPDKQEEAIFYALLREIGEW